MNLAAAIDELTTDLKTFQPLIDWRNQYSARNKAFTVLKTNRKVERMPDHCLPCIILEFPDGQFGQRTMGNVTQEFSHQIDLVFGIQVKRDDYENAFDARTELVDQVLPQFFLNRDRYADYVNDAKLIDFQSDSGVYFPKMFVSVTVALTGYTKRG